MSEQEIPVMEYVLYEHDGDVPFGDHDGETVVFQAASEDEVLKLAEERYGINPKNYYAQTVALVDAECFDVAPTSFDFGICCVLPDEDGRRAVAVFDLKSPDAKLIGFLDGDGLLCKGPAIFDADDHQAIIDVTTRRWPFPDDKGYGHMVCGKAFALHISGESVEV